MEAIMLSHDQPLKFSKNVNNKFKSQLFQVTMQCNYMLENYYIDCIFLLYIF